MTVLNIGYSRRVEVSMEVEIVAVGVDANDLMEGLTAGSYEVMTGTGEIINGKGEIIARYKEYEEDHERHGEFELFEE